MLRPERRPGARAVRPPGRVRRRAPDGSVRRRVRPGDASRAGPVLRRRPGQAPAARACVRAEVRAAGRRRGCQPAHGHGLGAGYRARRGLGGRALAAGAAGVAVAGARRLMPRPMARRLGSACWRRAMRAWTGVPVIAPADRLRWHAPAGAAGRRQSRGCRSPEGRCRESRSPAIRWAERSRSRAVPLAGAEVAGRRRGGWGRSLRARAGAELDAGDRGGRCRLLNWACHSPGWACPAGELAGDDVVGVGRRCRARRDRCRYAGRRCAGARRGRARTRLVGPGDDGVGVGVGRGGLPARDGGGRPASGAVPGA